MASTLPSQGRNTRFNPGQGYHKKNKNMVNITDDKDSFDLSTHAPVVKVFPDSKTKLIIHIGGDIIMCTAKQMQNIVQITISHYRQKAVFYYMVSSDVHVVYAK